MRLNNNKGRIGLGVSSKGLTVSRDPEERENASSIGDMAAHQDAGQGKENIPWSSSMQLARKKTPLGQVKISFWYDDHTFQTRKAKLMVCQWVDH